MENGQLIIDNEQGLIETDVRSQSSSPRSARGSDPEPRGWRKFVSSCGWRDSEIVQPAVDV